MNKIQKIGKSFICAGRGIAYCVRHERNIRIHIVALLYVLYFSTFYDFSKAEYAVIVLTCVVVMALELINTAIEVVIDKMSPKFNVFAMIGKDIAAGGVLVGAIGAVVVGVILFLDFDKLSMILKYFTENWYRPAILVISFILSILFIGNTKKRGGSHIK